MKKESVNEKQNTFSQNELKEEISREYIKKYSNNVKATSANNFFLNSSFDRNYKISKGTINSNKSTQSDLY